MNNKVCLTWDRGQHILTMADKFILESSFSALSRKSVCFKQQCLEPADASFEQTKVRTKHHYDQEYGNRHAADFVCQ